MAQDPYRYFRIEARELLEGLGRCVMELEADPPPAEAMARALRLAHTLKGAARVVRLPRVAERAHAVEDALLPFRERGGALPRTEAEGVLRLLDEMAGEVSSLDAPVAAPAVPAESREEEAPRALGADAREVDALLDQVRSIGAEMRALRRVVERAEQARHLADLLVGQLDGRMGRDATASAGGGARAVAEGLRRAVAELERGLSSGLERAEAQVREAREAGEQLRLAPASVLFGTLERTARDAARAVGREVRFEGRGGEVRLDGAVLAAARTALVQAVRNAVAHGIEPAAERRAAGKPEAGRVELEVTRRGHRVTFVCRDDGRGVDLEAVRRAATARGTPADAAGRMGREDLIGLLLGGGLSTSRSVSEVSGRGLGLDVVREAAARLSGRVSIHTESGAGTALSLELPVTMTALDAVVVDAGRVEAAVPLASVRRVLRVRPRDVARGPAGATVLVDGDALPYRSLGDCLGARPAARRGDGAASALLVEASGGARAVVEVEGLRGVSRVVQRPVPEHTLADPMVSGAFTDAEGDAQLVLDPDGLVAAAGRGAAAAALAVEARTSAVLVVDDSLTTRMLEKSILESAGFEVDLAASGEEGLRKARARAYALFLVDVEMPGMDGFTFVETVRSDPELRGVPAILVTSRGDPEDRRRGLDAGARDYIVKSEFDQRRLLDTIRRLVG